MAVKYVDTLPRPWQGPAFFGWTWSKGSMWVLAHYRRTDPRGYGFFKMSKNFR